MIQANLILEFGSGSKEVIYDIDGADIPAELAKALPALHALSGCDSTSSFSGIGKKKCLQVLKSDQRFIEAPCLLGENAAIPNVVLEVIEEYVCLLYGITNETSVNVSRYKLFTNRRKFPDPNKLPPTQDALYQHIKRVNYQVREWKQALDTSYQRTDPNGNGWRVSGDGNLEIKWGLKKPALDSILEFAFCGCKRSRCTGGSCGCFKLSLPCSELCECIDCENVSNESLAEDDNDITTMTLTQKLN